MRTVAGPCLQSCTTKLQAAGPSHRAQAVQLNQQNPADHHSPLCPLQVPYRDPQGPGPIIAAPYLYFAQLQSKSTSEKEKLGCFIDFQTTLVFD